MTSKIELKPDQTILFIGDSITDCFRREDAYQPLGRGYVNFVANWLLAKYPQLNLKMVNTAIGGETTRDLKGRWQPDCIDHNPDILSIMIGINDLCWRFSDPDRLPCAVYPDEYEENYRWMLQQVRNNCDCQIVLAEPFMFCSNLKDFRFIELNDIYIKIVHKIANEFDTVLIPLQKSIDEAIGQIQKEKWAQDMFHPYTWAHAWIAQRWLEATKL